MKRFRIPAAIGTAFQRRVWTLTLSIPKGRTRTYGWMAKRLHSSPRAVGQALKVNPYAPQVPCHRVVAASGLGGYQGTMHSRRKLALLRREGGWPAPSPSR